MDEKIPYEKMGNKKMWDEKMWDKNLWMKNHPTKIGRMKICPDTPDMGPLKALEQRLTELYTNIHTYIQVLVLVLGGYLLTLYSTM